MKLNDNTTGAKSLGGDRPLLGVLEWFRPGEHERVERTIADLKQIGISNIRTGFSWADYYTEEGQDWYDWLMPRLAADLDVLPCFTYTPPSIGVEPKTSSPPKNPRDYADFLDVMITKYGDYFEWVELWNEPNNLNDWDWRLDRQWGIFSEMVTAASYWCHERGKKTVLGGMCPTDPNWIDLMCNRGAMEHMDAIGMHGFPGTWEYDWKEWEENVAGVKKVLDYHGYAAEIWITEAGYSTWDHDEYRQLREFVRLADAPVDRAYWYSLYDLHPDLPHQDGHHQDERHYHFGLLSDAGKPKLLYRVLSTEGMEGVRDLAAIEERSAVGSSAEISKGDGYSKATAPVVASRSAGEGRTLITGGAGFIGTNLTHRILSSGRRVRIYDNISRPGVEQNLRWLMKTHGDRLEVELGDIRNPYRIQEAVLDVDQVFHLAAQVAVTTSVDDPRDDFATNLQGTFNLLEAIRRLDHPPSLLFTSTNKVYGGLEDIALKENEARYDPVDPAILSNGVSDARSLSFHSPYGCSKGAADQYVLDYARIYDLKTAVFRMSCIYGPHQFGTEDQGWVAHFLIQALKGKPITLYGDGKQVRDLLYVGDLMDAMLLAQEKMDRVSGKAFNIGGGPANSVSLLELLDLIADLTGDQPDVRFDAWRPGDQRYYVSDVRHFTAATGWEPKVGVRDGVATLCEWLAKERVPSPLVA